MPRVAFYCPQAAPLFEPSSTLGHGGAEIDIYYLARWLSRLPDWEVHVLVAAWDGADGSPVETVDGVTLHPFYTPGRPFNLLTVPRKIGKRLKQVAPDVVLQEAAGAETGLLAGWCANNDTRFVYRVAHDIDCNGEYLRWSYFRGWLFRRGLRAADRVIALTHRQADLLAETFDIQASVLPYAHPPITVAPRPHADRKYVLWIGRFQDWKRPEIVLQLARRLPELQFRLVGRLEGVVAGKLQFAAKKLPNVTLPGSVPYSESGAQFDEALALVSTSRYEGYPHAFLQAQRAGTPVCSYEVDPDGTLASAAYGSLAQGDLDRMTESLLRLANDSAHFDGMAATAQRHFSESHDLQVVVPRLANLLAEVA